MSNVIVRCLNYMNEDALENVVAYGLKVGKDDLDDSAFVVSWGGNGVLMNTPRTAIHSFETIKRLYDKSNGNLLHHVIINLKCDKKINQLIPIAREICTNLGFNLCDAGFQNMYFIHPKNGYVHIHLVMNSINYLTGNRIQSTGWLGNNILKYLKINYYYLDWEFNPIYSDEKYYYNI